MKCMQGDVSVYQFYILKSSCGTSPNHSCLVGPLLEWLHTAALNLSSKAMPLERLLVSALSGHGLYQTRVSVSALCCKFRLNIFCINRTNFMGQPFPPN
jgi:hypothetical protein